MSIVFTGFEPFGGAEVNASWEAVRRLAGVQKVRLPVSFARVGGEIRGIVDGGPDAVVCVGEAGGRDAIAVERVALNLMDARIPDNDGAQPADAPIDPHGPVARLATLPTRGIVRCINEAGLPAALSYTAGTYVCNAAFYALLDAVERSGRPVPAGFIHVPARGMAAEDIARGLAAAARCIEDSLRGKQ